MQKEPSSKNVIPKGASERANEGLATEGRASEGERGASEGRARGERGTIERASGRLGEKS